MGKMGTHNRGQLSFRGHAGCQQTGGWQGQTLGALRKLLERYGDLLDGLSHSFDATSTTIGFDAPYAAYHEFGTKHMPRRGLLTADPNSGTLGAEDREAILDIVANYLLP